MVTKSRVVKKHARKQVKRSTQRRTKPAMKSVKNIHVVTVVVAAGPYRTQQEASRRRTEASRIKNTAVGKISKVAGGYSFAIIQRFGARTAAEKERIIKMVHAHRDNHGVHAKNVKVSSQLMAA